MYFLSAKFRAHLELAQLLDDHPTTVFVQDRTIYEDAEIFATTLHRSGVMNDRDFSTYMGMYGGIRDSLPKPDLLIYLRCSMRTLRKRIKQRGRAEEQDIDIGYLKQLHGAYEDWFERYDLGPTLIIEADRVDYLSHLVDRIELTAALERVLHPGATRQA